MLDFTSFYSVPATFPAEDITPCTEGVKPIFLAGPQYKGKETRIFAWYSLPEGASKENKVPGIVLLHGGGGTSYSYWAKMWNDRGFAAVVPDIFGGYPGKKSANGKLEVAVESHEFSGPLHKDWYKQADEPVEDQWGYHAIAATVIAHSFLRSMEEVDSDRTGITGISWGGFTTALAIPFDSRFKFAMPVYGCGGFMNGLKLVPGEASSKQIKKWASLWDPQNYLSRAKMPVLWLNGSHDTAFDVMNWNKTASLPMKSYRSLRVDFPHGQYPGSEAPELLPFAKSVLEERQYPVFSKVFVDDEGERLAAKLNAPVKVTKAKLIATRANPCWNDCLFREYPARVNLENGSIVGDLPDNWTAAYLLIEDETGSVYSSEVTFAEEE